MSDYDLCTGCEHIALKHLRIGEGQCTMSGCTCQDFTETLPQARRIMRQQAERIKELEVELDSSNQHLERLRAKAAAYMETAEREQGNAIGAYFEQCGITLDRAIKETEYLPTKPEVEAKQPPTPTPTPVQPRKRHHYDPNGWYL